MSRLTQPRTLDIVSAALPAWQGMPLFIVSRFAGKEKLGKLYDYTVDLTTNEYPGLYIETLKTLVDIDALVGKEATVRIAIDGRGRLDAPMRELTGVVTEARCVGTDARRAFYRLRLRPWLWLATLNRDSRIFQDYTVIEISGAVLQPYPYLYEMRLAGPGFGRPYPKRDYQRQCFESDFDFLARLWQEWGITFHMEGNRLVLCDSPGGYRRHEPACETVRYQDRDGQRIDEEHVHAFEVARALTTGKVTLTDYDYTRPLASLEANDSDYRERARDNAEEYAWGDHAQPRAGAMGLPEAPNDTRFEAGHLARVRLEAHRAKSLRARGKGNLRGLTTGRTFHLEGYPLTPGDGEYLVVSTKIEIVDNDTTTSRVGVDPRYSVKTRFTAQRANVNFRTPLKAKKPRSSGETAVVTGPEKYPVWTDAYGRVLVRFVWERTKGRADHYTSCWMRVSSPWQGERYGAIWIPRVGHEVVVGYHDNDPDRPFVVGRHINGFGEPPWRLPVNHALSGWRSRSLRGADANSVVTDDTPGKLQVQMASDQAQSRLGLGSITLIDGHRGRGAPRGEGFELASAGHGVVRANRGVLITTEARSGATAPIKDMGETVQRLTAAGELHAGMGEVAWRHGAQGAPISQADVAQAISAQNDAIRGAGASPDDPSPEMTRPDLVLASAAGVAVTSAGSTHLASQTDHAVTAGRDVSIAAGRSLLAAVKSGMSFLSARLGIKLVAAQGAVELQAQSDRMSLTSLKDVAISSSDGKVTIESTREIWIGAGGSYIRISEAGIENVTPGRIVEKCATWEKPGPESVRRQQDFFESQQRCAFSQQVLVDAALYPSELGQRPHLVMYRFVDEHGAFLGSGLLDETGQTLRAFTDTPRPITAIVDLHHGKWTTLRYNETFPLAGNPDDAQNAAVFDYDDHKEAVG